MRQTQIRQYYADAYNLQAKFICSYKPESSKGNGVDGDPSYKVLSLSVSLCHSVILKNN